MNRSLCFRVLDACKRNTSYQPELGCIPGQDDSWSIQLNDRHKRTLTTDQEATKFLMWIWGSLYDR